MPRILTAQALKERTLFLDLITKCDNLNDILATNPSYIINEIGDSPLCIFLGNFHAPEKNFPNVKKIIKYLLNHSDTNQTNSFGNNFLHILFPRIKNYPELSSSMVFSIFELLKTQNVDKYAKNIYGIQPSQRLFATVVNNEFGNEPNFTAKMAPSYLDYFSSFGLKSIETEEPHFFKVTKSLIAHHSIDSIEKIASSFADFTPQEQFNFFTSYFCDFARSEEDSKIKILDIFLKYYPSDYQNHKQLNLFHLAILNDFFKPDEEELFYVFLKHKIPHTKNWLGQTPSDLMEEMVQYNKFGNDKDGLITVFKKIKQCEEHYCLNKETNLQSFKIKKL